MTARSTQQSAVRFTPGQVIARYEVLDGRDWIAYPVRVVTDEPDLLAVHLAHGTPLSFGEGPFRWGTHPWREIGATWQSSGVLQLQRPGDGYAVWLMRDVPQGWGWYVNFQRPLRRLPDGFETLDQELDLWLPGDGGPLRWKDVDHFEQRAREGGFEDGEAEAVRAAAEQVARMAATGHTWWTDRWSDWRPPAEWLTPPPAVALR